MGSGWENLKIQLALKGLNTRFIDNYLVQATIHPELILQPMSTALKMCDSD